MDIKFKFIFGLFLIFVLCSYSYSQENYLSESAEPLWSFKDISNIAWAVGMDEDAQNIIATSSDGNIYLTDINGNLKKSYKFSLEESGKILDSGAGNKDNKISTIVAAGTKVCLINMVDKKEEWCKSVSKNESFWAVSMSKNGKFYVTGTSSGNVELYDEKGNKKWEYKIPVSAKKIVWKGVSVSNDGEVAVTSYENIFVLKDGNTLWNKSLSENIETVKITQNGKYVACGCRDGRIHIFDNGAEKGKEIKVLESGGGSIKDISLNEDGFGSICEAQTFHYIYIFSEGTTVKDVEIYYKQFGVELTSTEISKNGRYVIVSPATEGSKGIYFFDSHEYIKNYMGRVKQKINGCVETAKKIGMNVSDVEENVKKIDICIEDENYKLAIEEGKNTNRMCEDKISGLRKEAENRISEVDNEIEQKRKEGHDVEDAEKCINESRELFSYSQYKKAKDKADECHKIINPPPFPVFLVILLAVVIIAVILWFHSKKNPDPVEEEMKEWENKGFDVPFELKKEIEKQKDKIYTYRERIESASLLIRDVNELLKNATSKERDEIEEFKEKIYNDWYKKDEKTNVWRIEQLKDEFFKIKRNIR
ncbi:MAG: hypothetical protein CVT88_00060 [Candidatus Altiarchaeales archaeon HGW-Altiarchaeales-1]|nr:MAG: hypothetical protein CVT88_00060 [Candidatus Altiarchaeales archaeon HGW-Altiarchaeales-1]